MNIKDYEPIMKSVKKAQTKQRYQHTLGVAYTASALAMKYGTDIQQAYLAGILHDCAKCISDEKLQHKCEKNHISITDFERNSPYLLHSKLGAFYAREKYNIQDEEILNSIIHHTTGKPDMSMLEKIIFVADYIEPNRYKAPNLDEIRQIAFENIDRAVYIIMKDTLSYLKKTKSSIDNASIETFHYYKELINDETEGE